jgi:DNA repair protein RadA/Sms
LEDILKTIKEKKIQLFILDSIQTVYSAESSGVAGSLNQVKYCSEKLSEFSKQNNISSIIIGHITKSGEIAGPKYLEHIVDVVAYLE